MKRILLLLMFFANLLFAQITLIQEELKGKEYSLNFVAQSELYSQNIIANYKLWENYNKAERETNKELLEFAPIDLFIAIPANETPKVNISYKSENIEKKDEASLLGAIKVLQTYPNKNIVNLGVKSIGNDRCLHLQVYPLLLKFNRLERISEISVNIKFKSTPVLSERGIVLSDVVCNKATGGKFQQVKRVAKRSSETKWFNTTNDYIKFGVGSDAIYRIYGSDFKSYGISPSTISPKSVKLFCKGEEIPIFLSGESDGQFDDDDFIEFVGLRNMGEGNYREATVEGERFNEYLGRYTDTTAYWITWGGSDGLRVKTHDDNSIQNANRNLDYYTELSRYERNVVFEGVINSPVRKEFPQWNENQTWYEGLVWTGKRDKAISLKNVFPNKAFKMFAKVADYACNTYDKSHHLALGINNNAKLYDSTYMNKYKQIVLEGTANSNLLKDGNNVLSLHSIPTQATLNVCLIDWFEIEYPRYLYPLNDSIRFKFDYLSATKAPYSIQIAQLTSDNYSLWKYGDTFERITLAKSEDSFTFKDSVSKSDRYILLENGKIKKPYFYYKKNFKNIASTGNSGEYIIITHDKFIEKGEEYLNFIESSYNITGTLVNINDIYDEYSYGLFNPETIKDFLKEANETWTQTKPKYVLLAGGACYDYYHNKERYGNFPHVVNYVPSFGAPISDNWFVNFDDQTYNPVMMIGRLPVTEVEQFDHYLEKHKAYLSQKYDKWNKSFLFFSGGDGDSQGELDQFRVPNEYIIENYVTSYPIGGNASHFYKTINPTTNFGPFSLETVQNSIDEGGVFIAYIGHSGTRTWDNSINEPEQLDNKREKPSLITDFGCSTARLAEPDITSFSELFTVAERGQAIAYIGNASLGFTSTAVTCPKLFYKKLLADSIYTISDALTKAKQDLLATYGSSSVNKLFTLTNSLVGDPIVELAIPRKPNLKIEFADISTSPEFPIDSEDSVEVTIRYANLGIATKDSFNVSISDENNEYLKSLRIQIPLYRDSIVIKVPVKDKAGLHNLAINFDSLNEIDEIEESDNSITYEMNVASASMKNNLSFTTANGIDGAISFYNPLLAPISEELVVEIGTTNKYVSPIVRKLQLDTLLTELDISALDYDKRYWVRAKLEGSENFGLSKSFVKSKDMNYLLCDSLSFASGKSIGLKKGNSLCLDTAKVILSAFSAGFSDGQSAFIFKNDTNYVPENFKVGHHLGIFNKETMEFVKYINYNTYSGGAPVMTEYKTLLDTLSEDYLVVFAIADEGRLTDIELKEKIKSYGSQYIDNVGFRASWAMIGYKGANPGTVPEKYNPSGQGPVRVDSTFRMINTTGSYTTEEIASSGKWKRLKIISDIPAGASIAVMPIGIRKEGADTLAMITVADSLYDISSGDYGKYKKLKFVNYLRTKQGGTSPSPILKSFGVSFDELPEIGLNYQTVTIESDSIKQGNNNVLDFFVENLSSTSADSVDILVELVREDNTKRPLAKYSDFSFNGKERKTYHVEYEYDRADKWGNLAFAVSIDKENKVEEIIEGNNNITLPFFIERDTTTTSVSSASVAVTFDGKEISEYEYVSAKPKIEIELEYPVWFPVTDTSAIKFLMDGMEISHDAIEVVYDTINRKVVYIYEPTLETGEHTFHVYGENIYGRLEDVNGYLKTFVVSDQLLALDVYNYPNPCAGNTDFVFRLTQIPEEMQIKVFTITGRLIREIELTQDDLKFNFNHIHWDCKDEDNDEIANGVYLYKVILRKEGKTFHTTQKLAIMR